MSDFDWEAYVHKSQFDTSHRMDPLLAVRVFADYFGQPGYDRSRDCSRCERDDAAPKTITHFRPPGTCSREACHGCAVSFLNGESALVVRDRLFSQYVEEREKLADHHASRGYQQTPAEKKKWRAQRDRRQQAVDDVVKACKMAGFDPSQRLRAKTRRSGVIVSTPLGDRERTFYFDHVKLGKEGAV